MTPGRLVLLLWLLPAAAAAQLVSSAYEDRIIDDALAREALERDPEPAGKTIEAIRIVSEDIVAPTDPYPRLLNVFHVRTRPYVIRRELLFTVGQTYDAELVAETERNLRDLFILAVARVVAARGSAPGQIILVVATKDLWSLRFGSEFSLVEGNLLQYLRVRPNENNFLGNHQQLALDFELSLGSVGFGQLFTVRRLFGTTLSLQESARLFFSRETGRLEGSAGGLAIAEPLVSLADPMAFSARVFWDMRPRRIYRGRDIWRLPYPDATAPTAFIPFVFNQRVIGGDASFTRSYGTRVKLDLTGTLNAYARTYEPPASSALDDDQRAWFACNGLPRTEHALLVGGSATAFEPRYQVLSNVETFGLSEDYQLGGRVSVAARWADPLLFSSDRYGEAGLALRYRALIAGDLLTVSAAASTRFMPGPALCGVAGPFVNRRFAAQVHNISPVLGIGRLVFRAMVDLRHDWLSQAPLTLGGSNGLRGADAEQYVGSNVVLVNLEYRTLPVELWTLHAGLVLFADGGAAFPQSPWIQSVGIGLRLLFPQFDRETVRIDFGYVLNEPGPPRPAYRYLSATFGQITDYRPGYLDWPLN